METVNPQQVQRVWQRLQGAAPEPSAALDRLIREEWETSAACLALARRSGGRFGPILRQLAQHSRSRWACLQGCVLQQTGKHPRHAHPQPLSGSSREILQRCLDQSLERIRIYRQLPEPLTDIGQLLAREQAQDCRQMMELLGNWEEK